MIMLINKSDLSKYHQILSLLHNLDIYKLQEKSDKDFDYWSITVDLDNNKIFFQEEFINTNSNLRWVL